VCPMMLSLIAAVSEDGIIGQDGRIPWRLPRDIAHFRNYCAGKYLLLGRRTYEEMSGWFQDHHPLIMSRDAAFEPTVGTAVRSVDEALALARMQQALELVVLGGGEIFALALPFVERLILTTVHTRVEQGTRFPDWAAQDWRCLQQETFPADHQHAFRHTIATYQRIPHNSHKPIISQLQP
jgi:dihydrofolate reductase